MNIEEIKNEILEELLEMETENRKWLSTQELADYIAMSVEQLELWRRENYGPSYLKLGKRKVIYPKAMVAEFIVANPIKTM
ncbi:helix-turn-helix transcriptional regulator [Aliarcobacter cryaerophilus]|uniref:helix-turn-helix transcriptional regulator n=1 Tax=Aliarcobacter cryaerophilus TaxID=28198 RepID=UPI0021B6BBFC|nr:hypothetical protein [Aliarcobacter cryaerophilus]MCT7469490.1 hypothetical protein [Aliarcobacter cryaerophilus]